MTKERLDRIADVISSVQPLSIYAVMVLLADGMFSLKSEVKNEEFRNVSPVSIWVCIHLSGNQSAMLLFHVQL